MALPKVKDVMLPLDEYAVVSQDMSMLDALYALEESIKKLPSGKHRHRAMLVVDAQNHIVGKLGHLAFLKGLEPRYEQAGDLGVLAQAGLSSDFINSMMENLNLWKEHFSDYVERARRTKIKEVMHPVTESIDENAPLSEAIHKIVVFQSLSILVTRGDSIVGILRLADLFDAVADLIKNKSEMMAKE